VRLEVRQPHNDFFRSKRRGQGGDTFHQLLNIKLYRVAITGGAFLDGKLHVARQRVKIQQGLRVNTNHAVNDELKSCQTHALVGQALEVEGAVRIADVHHDLELQLRHGLDAVLAQFEIQL